MTQISPLRKAWMKCTQWEFWPFSVLYFPVHFYYTWLAIKYRSFFFFTASNPSIDFGGMLGESKAEIFNLLPQGYIAKYKLLQAGELIEAQHFADKIGYPLIVKPNVGERGKLVELINSLEELENYVAKCPVPFLMQEFVDFPVELGVFFVRYPGSGSGRVTSVVQKDFLSVTGDGKSTVRSLLEKTPRAVVQLDFNHPRFEKILKYKPAQEEKVIVEPIGNHCRGTLFLNRADLIDEGLNHAFDNIASQIEGFYFGRFDLRCRSVDDLKQLKNFKILELNGAGSEPGHIYHPGYSIWKGYKSIFWHLNVLGQISKINKDNGFLYWSFSKGIKKIMAIRRYNRLIQNIK